MKTFEVFDSTLRDGAQGEGISFSVQDKLSIVKILDDFGIDYIEAGNPGSNPKDIKFFEQLKNIELKRSKLVAFGSTCRKGENPSDDKNIQNIISADTPAVAIFGKSWDLHVTKILKITLEENLKIISDTISYLKSNNKEVIFDAEHFFDGYKENADYAMKVLETAKKAGADVLCLCDTNGGCMPYEISQITQLVCKIHPDMRVAIHCHDDTGCAIANTVTAVLSGVKQVQGTFIGFGERCGNADLSVIIPNLILKCGYESKMDMGVLKSTATAIGEISNVRIKNNKPYIGKSAFAHKGGMHIDGVQKVSRSFEHIDPTTVGNERKFLMSEVSGRGTVLPKIQMFAPQLTKSSPETIKITEELKKQEYNGYQYEGASASFELFVKKQLDLLKQHFKVILFKTTGDFPTSEGGLQSSALVQIEVDGKCETAASLGNGPVNALDLALRKALTIFYPQVGKMHLTDYKVRVIDSGNATASKVRVLIESTDGKDIWTTVGVSKDIIEASFLALIDSFEYKLSKKER